MNSKLPFNINNRPLLTFQFWIIIFCIIIFSLYLIFFYLHYESRKRFWLYDQNFSISRVFDYIENKPEFLPARNPYYKFFYIKSNGNAKIDLSLMASENSLLYIKILANKSNLQIAKRDCSISKGLNACSLSFHIPKNISNSFLVAEIIPTSQIYILSDIFLLNNEKISASINSGNRNGLWFGDPNLAGHTFTSLLILIFLLHFRSKFLYPIFLIGFFDLYLTGSRTAWLSLLISMCFAFWLNISKRIWINIFAGLAVLCVVSVLWFHPALLGRLGNLDQPEFSRESIWSVAISSIRMNLFSGISADDFAKSYERTYPLGKGQTLKHAHNFWLQMGVRFGVLGLIGSMFLTAGIFWIAWYFGSWRGLAFATPFFLMNVFDYSLDYIGVWIPLFVGLWYLKFVKSQKEASGIVKST
jgi:O-Antigen ligase